MYKRGDVVKFTRTDECWRIVDGDLWQAGYCVRERVVNFHQGDFGEVIGANGEYIVVRIRWRIVAVKAEDIERAEVYYRCSLA